MKHLYFQSAAEWRSWLEHNHDRFNEVGLVFYKKESGEASLSYEEAVCEALCYGWIDSIIKKLDDRRYLRKFTPRNDNSPWSESNKKRVQALLKQNRMAPAGLARIEAAKRNGRWTQTQKPFTDFDVSPAFQTALKTSPNAKAFFEQLAPTYRKQFTGWINSAKRSETRDKRIRESIALLENGRKLGLR